MQSFILFIHSILLLSSLLLFFILDLNPVSNVIKISQKINKFDIDDYSFGGWTDELDNILLKSIIEFSGDFDLISESFEMIDKCRNNTNSEKNESTSSSSDINVHNKNEKKNAPNDLSTLQKIAIKWTRINRF